MNVKIVAQTLESAVDAHAICAKTPPVVILLLPSHYRRVAQLARPILGHDVETWVTKGVENSAADMPLQGTQDK